MDTNFVAQDKSFKQASASARYGSEVGKNPKLSVVTSTTVRQFLRAMTAIKLQHIHEIVCDNRCWE